MKIIGATMSSMNKKIAAKDGSGAAADAQNLEATLKKVEDFWERRRGADDAVLLAMNAKNTAEVIAKAASAYNLDDAAVQVENLQGDCSGCHKAYREGTPGSFKIKCIRVANPG
jgi:cytochrome c556